MKYFTKYLPVEGEIKEGDEVYNTTTLPAKINKALPSSDLKFLNSSPRIQKVKLFLCSRYVPENWDNPYVDYWDGIKEENRYRVIGEISPDALDYVKEGDEFDESDIKIIYALELEAKGGGQNKPKAIAKWSHKPTDADVEDFCEQWSHNYLNWDSFEVDWNLSKIFTNSIKIKCPTCKNFH